MDFDLNDPIINDIMGVLELARVEQSVRYRIPRSVLHLLDRVRVNTFMEEQLQNMVVDLTVEVLAEQKPPQTITQPFSRTIGDPRFATWWDMFKCTYRNRWWMRWRTWHVVYVDTPVTVRGDVEVKVRGQWTYPEAPVPLPLETWGQPVMVPVLRTGVRWHP